MGNKMPWETFYALWWEIKDSYQTRKNKFPTLVCAMVSCTYKKYLKMSDKKRDAVNAYLGWQPEQPENNDGNS